MRSMQKVTILGDVMCEPLLLKAARRGDLYDFSAAFKKAKEMLDKSDYLIANVETPMAGASVGFVDSLFIFNAPESFADALKEMGVDMALTANNHCLDRGVAGLKHTLHVLDKKGIVHTGTFISRDNREAFARFELQGQKVAVISYTYGTNTVLNKCVLGGGEEGLVNLLYPQSRSLYRAQSKDTDRSGVRALCKKILGLVKREHVIALKKFLGLTYATPTVDDYFDEEFARRYIQNMEADIRAAKEQCDLVLFCPHVGGQFNAEPGRFSQYVFKKAIAAGCDAIIASHPHIVQRAEKISGVPCFYSIGNFCMSPNSVYLLHEHLPEFGLAVHLYLERGKIHRISFSILKTIESKREMLKVYPVDILHTKLVGNAQKKLEEDCRKIYKMVTMKQLEERPIREEYPLWGE